MLAIPWLTQDLRKRFVETNNKAEKEVNKLENEVVSEQEKYKSITEELWETFAEIFFLQIALISLLLPSSKLQLHHESHQEASSWGSLRSLGTLATTTRSQMSIWEKGDTNLKERLLISIQTSSLQGHGKTWIRILNRILIQNKFSKIFLYLTNSLIREKLQSTELWKVRKILKKKKPLV